VIRPPQQATLQVETVADAAGLGSVHAIRRAVFVAEQKVPETLEMDGSDGPCRHYLARHRADPVGTARLRPLPGGEAKIERMAVLEAWRRQGVGRKILARIEADAARDGVATLVLHAQDHALGFYERCGFIVEGEGFEEAGIPHHKMRKLLTPETQRHRVTPR